HPSCGAHPPQRSLRLCDEYLLQHRIRDCHGHQHRGGHGPHRNCGVWQDRGGIDDQLNKERKMWKRIFVTITVLAAMSLIGAGTGGAASWTPLTQSAPDAAGTMLLLTDGTVMAQGYSPGNNWMRLTPDATGSYI